MKKYRIFSIERTSGRWPVLTLALSLICVLLMFLNTSCNKEKEVLYEVDKMQVLPPSAEKDKLKTESQYVAILYANLFQQALSAKDVLDVSDLIMSVGDKEVIHEIVISNFMNKSGVLMPTASTMRNDPEQFVIDAYERFFIRPPTQIEITWLVNYINSNQQVTPELVYFAMSTSKEYNFY